MMPQIDLVPNMKKAPGRCLVCNTTPTENGKPLPAIDLNVDVDWGGNAYLCMECVSVICDLMGRVTVEEHKAVKLTLKQLKLDHSNLREKFTKVQDERNTLARGEKIKRRRRKAA